MALMNALFLMSVLTLTLVAMIGYHQSGLKSTRVVKYDTQVYNVARAGLTDAIAWFKRQEIQPVETFAPTAESANVLKNATNDPSRIDPGGSALGVPNLGIVQEFEIDPKRNLWGRYEVGKLTRLTKDADNKLRTYRIREKDVGTSNWVDKPISAATSNAYEGVVDVGEDYGFQGAGTVWRIRSHGYVYRKDPSAPAGAHFYQYPNEVIAQTQLDTEIFRLQFRDYGAAIVADKGAQTSVNTTGPVKGGSGFGLLVNTGPLLPPTSSAQFSTDAPPPAPTYKILQSDGAPPNVLDWLEVFGVSDPSIIQGLATISGSSHVDYNYEQMSLSYFKPPPGQKMLFINNGTNVWPHKCLSSSGILIIDGDVYMSNWGSNQFSGYIYVSGDCELHGLFNLNGTLVVKGKLSVDPTNIEYDPSILSSVRQRLALYRERRAALRIISED